MTSSDSELSPNEQRVWRALMRLTVVLPRAIDNDLQSASGLQLTSHGVLIHLAEAPDRQMRMTELAEHTAMSPSRITRVVQALSAGGLVVQTPCADDGRSSMAGITQKGLDALAAAWPQHLTSMRSRVLNRIDAADMARFADQIDTLLATIEANPQTARQPAAGEV